ncbi:MAG: DUF2752 domain-containing protein [Ignavibacteria bacterium]
MKKLIINLTKKSISFISKNLELIFWVGGLAYLAFIQEQNHLSFCPIKNLGFQFCPGCGIGNSISLIYHLKILESLKAHPLGLFAFIIIIFRIIQLITKQRREHYV